MKLPKLIDPCPIIDVCIDIRFETNLPLEAIFGMLYACFRDEYTEHEKLPINQIPEEIRIIDKNLWFQPHYRLKSDPFVINIGPRSISFGQTGDYVGWDDLFIKIKDVFEKVTNAGIYNNVSRMGLRYINFSKEYNIFDFLNINLDAQGYDLDMNQTHLSSSIISGDFNARLNLASNATVTSKNTSKTGSLFDIDVYTEPDGGIDPASLSEIIDAAHLEEKKIFFGMLKPEALKNLNPQY